MKRAFIRLLEISFIGFYYTPPRLRIQYLPIAPPYKGGDNFDLIFSRTNRNLQHICQNCVVYEIYTHPTSLFLIFSKERFLQKITYFAEVSF